MPSASDDIRAAIADTAPDPLDGQRAISFERFMDLALYGPHGFYRTTGSAGRRGDFITSPEVGPLFGAVLAGALDAWWRELGEPAELTVVDAGAGPGTLARSVLAAEPACAGALRYVAVEISAAQRERHPDGIHSLDSLDSLKSLDSLDSLPTDAPPSTGVILANELLDNLAFRLLVMDGGWREAHVVAAADGRFAEILRPAGDLEGLPSDARHGARLPLQRQAAQWVATACTMFERGRLVVFDYASADTAALASRPWREWLRTYRDQARGQHYLRTPGDQDITVEVALDQLAAAAGPPTTISTQRQFLQRWGIDELVRDGKRMWTESASRPNLESLRMRSRVREAEALLADPGLGSFTVAEWVIGPWH